MCVRTDVVLRVIALETIFGSLNVFKMKISGGSLFKLQHNIWSNATEHICDRSSES